MSSVDMTLVSFRRMVMEGFNDEIGIDLVIVSFSVGNDS